MTVMLHPEIYPRTVLPDNFMYVLHELKMQKKDTCWAFTFLDFLKHSFIP